MKLIGWHLEIKVTDGTLTTGKFLQNKRQKQYNSTSYRSKLLCSDKQKQSKVNFDSRNRIHI